MLLTQIVVSKTIWTCSENELLLYYQGTFQTLQMRITSGYQSPTIVLVLLTQLSHLVLHKFKNMFLLVVRYCYRVHFPDSANAESNLSLLSNCQLVLFKHSSTSN